MMKAILSHLEQNNIFFDNHTLIRMEDMEYDQIEKMVIDKDMHN